MSTPINGSEFFTFEQFAVSASHPALVEPVPDHLKKNVEELVRRALDPIRYLLNRQIVILSGYRPHRLNVAVGGSPTSQHLLAEAVDWTTDRIRWVFRAMVARPNPYDVGQVIYYPDRAFVHLALPSTRFPSPTYQVHWPAKRWKYRPITSRQEFDSLNIP